MSRMDGFTLPTTTRIQETYWSIGWGNQQSSVWHPTRYTRWRDSGRHINSWSYLHDICMARGVWRPPHRVRLLFWINWQVKANLSTHLTCWTSSWKCMYPMPGVYPNINMQNSSCIPIYLMQSMLINSFLARVRHGHLQRVLWEYIESFSQTGAIEE